MEFRSLQTADTAEIFALLRLVYQSPDFPIGGSWNERLLEKELDKGAGLAGYEKGEMVAFVLYQPLPDSWEISLLATHPQHRRRGLMGQLIGELRRRRPVGTEIWLEVHEANVAARNLYFKLGFQLVGERTGYYRDGRAAVLYSLR